MNFRITKRILNDHEINSIVKEIRKFPNPLTSKKTWQNLKEIYVASNDRDLIGVCGITELKSWIKIGPFVVFEKYHNQGVGKKIFSIVLKDFSKSNLYIGSRNPIVEKIALNYDFKEEINIWKLPKDIKRYLFKYILENLSFEYISELIRKQPTKEGPFRNFLKVVKNRTSLL